MGRPEAPVEPKSAPLAEVSTPAKTFGLASRKSRWIMIGYADASQSNAFRVMAKAETEQAIADVDGGGAKLVYTNANDSAPTQLSDVNDLITQGVDAIVLSAVDVSGVCSSISKAVSAGIPVIIQERTVKCPDYTSF